MAGRIKHRERSHKTHGTNSGYEKYVFGSSGKVYKTSFMDRLFNLFKHQDR